MRIRFAGNGWHLYGEERRWHSKVMPIIALAGSASIGVSEIEENRISRRLAPLRQLKAASAANRGLARLGPSTIGV